MADVDPITRLHKRRTVLSRGVHVLPSLLTSAALFSGFYSIIYTLNAVLKDDTNFTPAIYAILLATVFDSLDGRMARLMRAETEFGSHFDSIADVVSFGVAPAVLAYSMALADLGRMGWLGAFMFLSCAAIRLARFNVISATQPSKKYFKGLSSPVAAGGLAISLLMIRNYVGDKDLGQGLAAAATIFLALLMVSNARFRSFKDLDFRRSPTQVFMLAILIIMLIVTFQEVAMFGCFIVYLIAGLVEEMVLFRRRRKSDPSVPFVPFGDREQK